MPPRKFIAPKAIDHTIAEERMWESNISINVDGDKRPEPRVVYIFGEIGDADGTTAFEVTQRVVELVQNSRHSQITVAINSPGGSVPDGLSMLDAFDMARANGVKVVTRCQGQAQSMAADLLALGGDLRSISPNSFVMTHGDWDKNLGFGDMLDLEAEMHVRNLTNNRLLDLYEQKTKRPRKFWSRIFKDSRPVYWTPQEARAAGLVDVIY